MLDLLTFVKALTPIGPFIATVPEVAKLVEAARTTLHPTDQAQAQEALEALQADNDEGHLRLQEILAEAAQRT